MSSAAKVALAVTNREGFVLASKALEGNPYDGHTLDATIGQVIAMTGVEPERTHVDRGYRGHDYAKKQRVFITRAAPGPHADDQARTATPVRDRADDRAHEGGRALGRNHLLGSAGDAINALLVAAGHNLRLILNWLRLFVAWLCGPDQFIRATGYFSGRLKSSTSLVLPHYSGPTT